MYEQESYIGTHRAPEPTWEWPVPTVDVPDMEMLMAMVAEDTMEATDGCEVEQDGTCVHGHPSWLLADGLV